MMVLLGSKCFDSHSYYLELSAICFPKSAIKINPIKDLNDSNDNVIREQSNDDFLKEAET